MPRYRFTIEYHGRPFVGWQRQAAGRSVQGVLEAALARLDTAPDGSPPAVQGAGRTDAGVHATGQVAHADLAKAWDPFRLTEALNHHLRPDPVAVLDAAAVADDFHARFSATFRRYLYRIENRRAPLAIEAGLAWRIARPLEIGPMREAAAMLTGRHDFTTFRSAQCQAASPVKTLDLFEISACASHVECRLGARSFLHNQVRSLVGTVVQAGLGRWPPARVAEALDARDRAACGPVAPPDGLYLAAVEYGEARTPGR